MSAISLSAAHKTQFAADGFVVLPGVLVAQEIRALRARVEPLFRGEFRSGLQPDEINWRAGRDPEDRTRQLCNVWKADPDVARVVLRTDIGRACAELGGWSGARLNQDNLFWKPPGAGAIGFHQDSAYEQWVVPSDMVSCWLALDDTHAAAGTVEYVRGSHRWGAGPKSVDFHAPPRPFEDVVTAARRAGAERPERVAIEVSAGDAVLHHGWTWHGSGENAGDRTRRSLVVHCMDAAARFHESEIGPVYGRYKRFGDTTMDESFFPILWRSDGYRSPIAAALAPDV